MLSKQFLNKKQLRGCIRNPHMTLWFLIIEEVHLNSLYQIVNAVSLTQFIQFEETAKHFVLCFPKIGTITSAYHVSKACSMKQ